MNAVLAPPRARHRSPVPTDAAVRGTGTGLVADPHDPDRLVAVVPLRTGAVATSGTARRGAHVVDARTGRPPSGLASVTVVGESLTAVDIDATAAEATVHPPPAR